jgi:hypothetical protein
MNCKNTANLKVIYGKFDTKHIFLISENRFYMYFHLPTWINLHDLIDLLENIHEKIFLRHEKNFNNNNGEGYLYIAFASHNNMHGFLFPNFSAQCYLQSEI